MPPLVPPGANTTAAAPALKTAYAAAQKKPQGVDRGAIRMIKRKVAKGR